MTLLSLSFFIEFYSLFLSIIDSSSIFNRFC